MGGGKQCVSLGTGGAVVALMRNACSGALFEVLDRAFEHPSSDEERGAMLLAGGIMQHGYQCGMTWGAALAAGGQAYRLLGAGPRAEARAIVAAGRLVESFRVQNGHVNCLELTGIDRSSSALRMFTYFLVQGGTVRCARRAVRFAPEAFDVIDAALAEPEAVPLQAPVSCSALLARKMGVSDERATMAAGLAGGIGLSGGACGALGAAIWIVALRSLDAGAAKVDFQSPVALDLVKRFLQCADFELECSKIVGRRFESVAEHARHLCGGGCATLLDVLVEVASASARDDETAPEHGARP